MNMPTTIPRIAVLAVLPALMLGGLLGAMARLYVGAEHTFYFWDWAGYHLVAEEFARLLVQAPDQAWAWLAASLRQDYPLFYAVPLAPVLAAFGGERAVYVTAVAVLYLGAFALAVAALMRKLFPFLGRAGFWAVACAVPLVPPAWGVVARGYPDALPAAFAVLAVLVGVSDPGWRRWRTPVLAGAMLAAAVLLRRHFGYVIVAFHLAAAVNVSLAMIKDLRAAAGLRRAMLTGLRLGLLPVVTVAAVHLGNPHFIPKVLGVDHNALYSSYQLAPLAVMELFAALAGWSLLLPALAGLALGLRPGKPEGHGFLVLFIGFWAVLWVGLVRQRGDHQILTVMVLALLFGHLVLIETARRKVVTASALVALLVVNAAWSFLPTEWQGEEGRDRGWRQVLARPYPPLRRGDYDEVARLSEFLRARYSDWRAIYVAAASRNLNFDLVQKAEPALHPGEGRSTFVFQIPEIDSRDPLPVEALMRAEVVLLADPPQYSLEPEAHDVVRVVLKAFAEGWPVASDFQPLGETFRLREGIVVTVWERMRPSTLADAEALLARMRPEVEETAPHYREYWSVTPPRAAHRIGWRPDGTRRAVLLDIPGPGEEPLRLARLEAPQGAVRLSSQVEVGGADCPGVLLSIGRRDGGIAATKVLNAGETHSFDVSIAAGMGGPEVIVVKTAAEGQCEVRLERLTVHAE